MKIPTHEEITALTKLNDKIESLIKDTSKADGYFTLYNGFKQARKESDNVWNRYVYESIRHFLLYEVQLVCQYCNRDIKWEITIFEEATILDGRLNYYNDVARRIILENSKGKDNNIYATAASIYLGNEDKNS